MLPNCWGLPPAPRGSPGPALRPKNQALASPRQADRASAAFHGDHPTIYAGRRPIYTFQLEDQHVFDEEICKVLCSENSAFAASALSPKLQGPLVHFLEKSGAQGVGDLKDGTAARCVRQPSTPA